MDEALSTSGTPSPPPPQQHQNPLLPRHNSISAPFPLPPRLTLPDQSSSSAPSSFSGDFDLIRKPLGSYTSLKDLLPTMSVNSPIPNSPGSVGSHISIRNRLVKQAAWAYLQPMSTPPPDSGNRSFFRRIWVKFSGKNPLGAVFRFFRRYVYPSLTWVFDWLSRAIGIRSYR